MIIFDTLSELESYLGAVPQLKHVITVMDRSLPYEKTAGDYTCPEEDQVKYRVDAFMTSPRGFAFTVKPASYAVVVALEGDEMLSTQDAKDVMLLNEGRFVLLSEGNYHRGISTNLPIAVKDVVFSFPSEMKVHDKDQDTL